VVWTLDVDTSRFLYISPSILQLRGLTPEEALRETAQQALTPESWEFLVNALPARIEEFKAGINKTYTDELSQPRKDGSITWVEINSRFVLNEENGHLEVYAASRNINARRQAQGQLKESGQRARKVLDDMLEGVQIIGFDWRYLYLNRSAEGHNRRPNEELLGQVYMEVWPGVESTHVFAMIKRCMEMRQSCQMQNEFVYPDGEQRWFDLNIRPTSEGVFIHSVDINERRQAQANLIESQRFNQAIIDALASNLCVLDENGTVLTVNRSWKDFAEANPPIPPDYGVGGNYLEICDRAQGPNSQEATSFAEGLRAILRGECNQFNFEYPCHSPSGEKRWFNARVTSFMVDHHPRVVVSHENITERELAQENLRKSEETYRYLFKNQPHPMWIYDLETLAFLEVNEAAVAKYGYSRAEFLQMTLKDIRPAEELSLLMDNLAQPRQLMEYSEGWHHRLKDGRLIDVSITSHTLQFDGREAVLVVAQDISERKRAEREIQQRNEDLLLINTLNEAANRGDDLQRIVEVLARETHRIYDCEDIAIYLLSPDARYIEMQGAILNPKLAEQVERVIGRPIPKIQIPLRTDSYFKQILANEQGTITSDPQTIQRWIEEFTETTFLPLIFRPVIRKIVPQIYSILNIDSTLSIPLTSYGQAIGILDMSSKGRFTEDDLRRIRSIRHQVTAVILRKQAEQQSQLQLRRMSALSEIDRAISSSLDMRLSLDILLAEVLSQLSVDAASILLLNQPIQTLEYVVGRGFHTTDIRRSSMRLGDGIAGQVGLERKVIHIPDLAAAANQFKRTDLLRSERFVEYFGVPLIAKGMLKGVLEVFHRSPLNPDLEWVNYLETLGGQAAIAIDSAQLFEGLQQSNLELITAYDATIMGWSHALDLRDRETEGHTRRVTELTMQLAERMGISPQEMIHVRRGALLHDIGKLGVPDQILLKPGPLTDEEWVIMRQHPTYAFNMLLPITYLRPALDIPYCHHEKWDGSGYPRGQRGEQIPLAARLFAIVDVWDALRSDRPYRASWSSGKTRAYILDQSGKHFDPRVVDVFLDMIGKG
jgi:PAS domain S-box-containing protein